MAPRERQQDDSENGVDPPHHVHYHQTKNGNGSLNSILLGLCGALLLILVSIAGFMWKGQIDFQALVIDRIARLETRMDGLERVR